jgi:hypothetical protein
MRNRIALAVWLAVVGEACGDSASAGVRESTAECFPACRKGYVCHEGQCVSKCNPPCPDNALCTDSGACIDKSDLINPYSRASYLVIPSSVLAVVGIGLEAAGIIVAAVRPVNYERYGQPAVITGAAMLCVSIPVGSFGIRERMRRKRWNHINADRYRELLGGEPPD